MASSVHPQPAVPVSTAALLADPPQQAHSVHFYEDPEILFDSVARFLRGGFEAGDRMVVIATSAHTTSITARIDASDLSAALAAKRLVLLDAHETLRSITTGEDVDAGLFDDMLERIVADVRADAPDARIRAYGEMVDLLWQSGRTNAALRLEELWTAASRRHDLTLLCTYAMGSFYGESTAERLLDVCDRHTHVVRNGVTSGAATASEPTAEERIRSLENELHHRRGLEAALRQALNDRSRVEAELRESIRREREARTNAEQNDASKEEFIAVLGHDLRNPLNTILTTARLMIMRRELAPESARRIERVVVSGVRMQRMIEQILDATSDRVGDGIRIMPEPGQDLAALASNVVGDLRAAHPDRKMEVVVDGAPLATFDGGRLEQVVRTLVGNAVVHGDPERPVRVIVSGRATELTFEVHNFGPPIDEAERAFLFEPLGRSRKAKGGRSEGLGLGLYIARRIATAHGGTFEVESSADTGTTFRVTLPLR